MAALEGADALVIVTEWKEFRSPDFDAIKEAQAAADLRRPQPLRPDKREGQQLLEELRFEHVLPLRSVFIIATAERKPYNSRRGQPPSLPPMTTSSSPTPGAAGGPPGPFAAQEKSLARRLFDLLQKSDHEAAIAACDRALKASRATPWTRCASRPSHW
jgi:hypothetical protein